MTGRRVRPGVVAVVLVLAACACGSGEAPDAAQDRPSTSVSVPAATTTTDEVEVAALQGVSGTLVITRQRDLLDRGLINVRINNDSGHDLIVFERALVASHFATEPAPTRRDAIRAGRQVALQVPYGIADDCASPEAVAAELVFSYSVDDETDPTEERIDLDGTDILDGIREEQCATQAFRQSTIVSFSEIAERDGTVTAVLHIELTDSTSSYVVSGASGTILVGVQTDDDFVEAALDQHTTTASIAVSFVVNRCDPHALAEVTKRYGLDLDVSIDGKPSQPIDIDVDVLVDRLEQIVESCRGDADES